MNKTLVKTLAVSTVLVGFATTSVFAKSPKGFALPDADSVQVTKNNTAEAPAADQTGRSRMAHMGFLPGCKPKSGPDAIGTVSRISASDGTITVRDADGNETTVHINPFTYIKLFDPQKADRKLSRDTDKTAQPSLTISDIKRGDYVMVRKLNGSTTKTIEAGRITIGR